MSLATPDNVRALQRKLYLKAKAEPGYRFYPLYDKVHRADVLRHAFALVRANKGAPCVDGVSCAMIEPSGLVGGAARWRGDLLEWAAGRIALAARIDRQTNPN